MNIQRTPVAVYLCPTGPCPGFAQVAGGLLAGLAERHGTVGVFRPIVAVAGADGVVTALQEFAPPRTDAPHWGVTAESLVADPVAAAAAVIARYEACAGSYDAVLVLGSSYDCALAPVEFTQNTRIAAHLQVPLILLVGAEGGPEELHRRSAVTIAEATDNLAQVLAVIALDRSGQRRSSSGVDGLPVPVFVVDELPALLPEPANAGEESDLIADGDLAGLLPRVRPTSRVVFESTRRDVPLGLLVAAASRKFPLPAAAVAVGPQPVSAEVQALWTEFAAGTPLLRAPDGLVRTSAASGQAGGGLDPVRVEAARRVFARQVDLGVLFDSAPTGPAEVVTPVMFEHRLLERARQADRHIVLPEGTEDRILTAAHRLLEQGICRLTLLGDPASIRERAAGLGLRVGSAELVDPLNSPWREPFAQRLAELRAHKGLSLEGARQQLVDVSYFGTMMVREGMADGMVSGAVHTTAHTIRPALQLLQTRPGVVVASSVFLMCLADRVLVFGDCAVNPNPTPEQLADIAINAAATAEQFGIPARVAMLSYSTGTSGAGPDVEHVVEATRLAGERAPQLLVDGPLQYDAAVDPTVARAKAPDSPVAGRATVLIFPDLQTGNNTYKAVQRSAGALAIGPILQGLNKPVNDLSRGALVADIVNTVAITAIQAAGTGRAIST